MLHLTLIVRATKSTCPQVVVAPRELHGQSMGSLEYSGSLSGEVRTPLSGPAMESLPMGPRKIIAHRCMLAFDRPHAIVNLGVGMPEVPPPLLVGTVPTSQWQEMQETPVI